MLGIPEQSTAAASRKLRDCAARNRRIVSVSRNAVSREFTQFGHEFANRNRLHTGLNAHDCSVNHPIIFARIRKLGGLFDEHAIAVRIKPVAAFYRVAISIHDARMTAECGTSIRSVD